MDDPSECTDRDRFERLLARWEQLNGQQRWRVAVIGDRLEQQLELRAEERRWLISVTDRPV